jgi:hypothetical protein
MDSFLSFFLSLFSCCAVIACRLLTIARCKSFSSSEGEELLPLLLFSGFRWRSLSPLLFRLLFFSGLLGLLSLDPEELLDSSEFSEELGGDPPSLFFLSSRCGLSPMESSSSSPLSLLLYLDLDLVFDLVGELALDADLDLDLVSDFLDRDDRLDLIDTPLPLSFGSDDE